MLLARLRSALADTYAVERELGAGGMATVYLAHDLKHDRDVAIKVLHPDLGAALGGDRFLSEIRTTAKLQHPHILPLLDSGDADGLLYYVMPYVTGETLRARLEREQQLPIADATRIAREVADALSAAHELHIIHRDIKPENILLQGGHAVVADFGIALAVQQAGGSRMTQTGLSLGTPQYMSPEQAMGERTIDSRSDIYALGAVTYEMLAGEPPFSGPTVQAIVAKVMSERPTPLSMVRDTVPAHVERAVLTALAKLPADRFSSSAEFASAIADTSPNAADASARPPRPRARHAVTLGLGALTLTLGVVMIALARRAGDDAFPIRIQVAGDALEFGRRGVLSPDGHTLVFVARGQNPAGATGTAGSGVLLARRLDRLQASPIPGSDNAANPEFSPDGKWIAFIAGRKTVVKIPVEGGTPVPLAQIGDASNLSWSKSGDIITSSGILQGGIGLLRVSASGGPMVPLTQVDTAHGELSHLNARVLEDGNTVLFTIWKGTAEQARIAATHIDDGKVIPLDVVGSKPLGVAEGHLVYVRGDGMIMAVPFDGAKLRTTGVAMPMGDSARFQGNGAGNGEAEATLSNTGALVFSHGELARHLVWVDKKGVSTPAMREQREINFLRIAPNGREAALGITISSKSDAWKLDFASGTLTPITTTGSTRNPVWSNDGRRILYVSTHGGRAALWSQNADGSDAPQKLAQPVHNPWNLDVAPDGKAVVFNAIYGNNTFNLETMSLQGDHALHDVAASPVAVEGNGRFSPDGHSIAYASNESGTAEIYVKPFPGDGGRVQISTGGGVKPRWAPDGKTLYYWQGRNLVATTLARTPQLRPLSTTTLFAGNYEQDFDVSPDGSRFLMIESAATGLEMIVIPNWRTELRRLTAQRPQH